MEISTNSICNDSLCVQLDDGVIDLSWSIDTDALKKLLTEQNITKILNLQENIDFIIQIDNVDTFNSVNLKQIKFSEIKQTYRGNIVFSAIIPFNKNKFEETQYYFRVKLDTSNIAYDVVINNQEQPFNISFIDEWSSNSSFTIRKNYTKDLIDTMYTMVADFNAYNKEVKSANMYYIFQAMADTLNKEYKYVIDEKNRLFINASLPDKLVDTFGSLFKFDNYYNISMEEYRRILKHLIIGYQNGGAWNYIKNVLKYLIGYEPELVTLKNFYPWVLRKAEIAYYNTDGTPVYNWNRPDPVDFKDRNYYNPESNYYLFKSNFMQAKDKNEVMLLNNYERLFSFIVKSDNFFNVNIDLTKIKTILNILKSAYTKYILSIENHI